MYPYRQGVEWAHRFPACHMRRLKGLPDGSACTAWNYAGFLCFYSLGWRDRGMPAENSVTVLKLLVPNPQLNPFFIWCDILLTGLHPFRCDQHSLPALKFLHTRPCSSLPYVYDIWDNHHETYSCPRDWHLKVSPPPLFPTSWIHSNIIALCYRWI